MTRTHATSLVLVNWKGIFYERFRLDRHVTALEGPNGAGKTTVMIAAYLVLLPDMTRVRFTNLGETGATGGDKGVWGRLGEDGRPSYAALELAVPGRGRIVAGVHLVRKGEPSVEPTPFLITGLDDAVRLQDVMLIAQADCEGVPELPELRENAARLGGRLQTRSAREYFADLFDAGALPMRLGTDEERGKFNEMLKTSMTGGISRALTSELRSFLLKEEAGLGDTLQTMRANLDACRRTRREVHESRQLEAEIRGVFDAGHQMFSCAFLAAREKADELTRRVAEAQAAHDAATAELGEAEAALAETNQAIAIASLERVAADEALTHARRRLELVQRALDLLANVRQWQDELAARTEVARAARDARDACEARQAGCRNDHKRAQEAYSQAAAGLTTLEQGVDELHRRAGAHRTVMRHKATAEECLSATAIAVPEITSRLAASRAQLRNVDRERRDLEVQLSDTRAHREAFARTCDALAFMLGRAPVATEAHEAALAALRVHRDRTALGQRLPELERERNRASEQADRQVRTIERARTLSVGDGPEPGADRVRRVLESAEAEARTQAAAERAARDRIAACESAIEASLHRERELVDRQHVWITIAPVAHRLAEWSGEQVSDRDALDRLRARIAADLRQTADLVARLETELAAVDHDVATLIAAGGRFDPALIAARDRLGADLLAAHFEDVDLESAAVQEARLGPLTHALVVDDPAAAATQLAGRDQSLSEIRLVSRDADLTSLIVTADQDAGTDVLVPEGVSLRVTRVPERPRLGRRAREARIADLRVRASALESELERAREALREANRRAREGDELLLHWTLWLAGDPADGIARERAEVEGLRREIVHHRTIAEWSEKAARSAVECIGPLRELLGSALLLDPPDHRARVAELTRQCEAAATARAEALRCGEAARTVEDALDVLRRVPLSAEDAERLARRVEDLREQRDRLSAAVDALAYVDEHRDALGWGDAIAGLTAQQALVPVLKEQLVAAQAALQKAGAARDAAEHAFDATHAAWQAAEGERLAAHSQHDAARDAFAQLGVPEPAPADQEAARDDVEQADQRARQAATRETELASRKGKREEVCRACAARRDELGAQVDSEKREAQPAVERWSRLSDQAARRGLAVEPAAIRGVADQEIRGHPNLNQEAQRQRAILLERLSHAQGAAPLVERLNREPAAGLTFAERILEEWLEIRDWLRQRLPAQVAEVDDPREALIRLRDQLSTLENRLERQEHDLRGASEDVARGIEVQLRKARGQVARLCRNLDGVRFGGIVGIRVRLTPVERMEQVLRALRGGEVQNLLFQDNLPFEEALEEVFRRYGGGRGGGSRLLDYREYAHLQVEVRRAVAADWESANPTRLSTGEAIGVGAALMMVVLTEWERDATLLRGKRASGSLRFLFLDEANRLSHDNLGVLFDLCQTLELQLLIAAPEVAQAAGNTTYHLVRRPAADGRDEVLVSGRRTPRLA